MPIAEPYPELDELLRSMGAGGHRISEIDASEAGAGNISVLVGWDLELRRRFPVASEIDLPLPAPALAGKTLLVTGSGRRLRQLHEDPEAAIAGVRVHDDGLTATMYASPRRLFEKLTSEFNSHLAVHQDQVGPARDRVPGGGARPADAPDVPVAHPRLPRHRRLQRQGAALGAGDRSSRSRRASGCCRSSCRAPRA